MKNQRISNGLLIACAIIGVVILLVFAVFAPRNKQKATERALQIDTLPTVTITDTAQYIPVFADGPKLAKRIKTKYFAPFVWSANYIKPRSALDNLMIGTTSSYNYKLYVTGGRAQFMDHVNITLGKRLYLGTNAYVFAGDNNTLSFYDTHAGTHTLTDLLSGGTTGNTFDTVKINAGANNWELLGYSGSLFAMYNGIGRVSFVPDGTTKGKVVASYANFSSNAAPTTVNTGDLYFNSVVGKYLAYNGSEWDTLGAGTGGGTLTGDTINFSDGSRIFGGGGQIDLQPAAAAPTNKLSFYTSGGGDTLRISSNNKRLIINTSVLELTNYTSVQDSMYLDYIGGASITGGVYLLLSPTQAIDTGRTQPASYGLKMPLIPIHQYLSDTLNGEMSWLHWDRGLGKWVSTYGVLNSDPIATDEAHTIAIEAAYRYIASLEERVTALENYSHSPVRMNKRETVYMLCLLLAIGGIITYLKIRK